MAELFSKLGIDWRLLLANTLTFFLVLWILRRFAYQPILSALDKRQHTISSSLDHAKQAKQEVEKLQQQKEEMLQDTRQQTQEMLHQAEQQAEAVRQEKLAQAGAEAKTLVDRTRQQLQREQTEMLTKAKGQLADLVVEATAKVLDESLDAKAERDLQAKAVKALKHDSA